VLHVLIRQVLGADSDEDDGEQFDGSNGTGSSHINAKPVLPDPAQAEIRERCWGIQDTWSPAEAQRRLVFKFIGLWRLMLWRWQNITI
jgi:hypothetical protein